MFSLSKTRHEPLQVLVWPVIQQRLDRFLQTIGENFRTPRKIPAQVAPLDAPDTEMLSIRERHHCDADD